MTKCKKCGKLNAGIWKGNKKYCRLCTTHCLACANRPDITFPVGIPVYCSFCDKRLVSYDESTETIA